MLHMIPNLVRIPGYQYLALPTGIHEASFSEVAEVYVYNPIREELFDGLIEGSLNLVSAGCKSLYLDGSYVTSKPDLGDFDACWDPTGVNTYLLTPELQDYISERASQKAKYGGEFVPSVVLTEGVPVDFIDFFQRILNLDEKKGIIRINIGNDPWLGE